MMKKFGQIVFLTALTAVPFAATAWDKAVFNVLPDNTAIVDVCGQTLSKSALLDDVALRAKIDHVKDDAADVSATRISVSAQDIERYIVTTICRKYARLADLKPSPTEVEARALKLARQKFDPKAKFSAPFMNKFTPSESGRIRDWIKDEILCEMVARHIKGGVPPVTDEEAHAFRQKMLDWNVSAQRHLDIIFEKATNIWQRIEKTGDFEKEAACFTDGQVEHITADPDWGEFTLQFFDGDPEMKGRLRALKVGAVTPPTRADNGLMIVKLLGKEPFGEGQTSYHLANIFFELPGIWKDRSDEQLKADMLYDRQQEHYEKTMKKLRDEARIDYPNGRDWIYKPARFRNRGKSLRQN